MFRKMLKKLNLKCKIINLLTKLTNIFKMMKMNIMVTIIYKKSKNILIKNNCICLRLIKNLPLTLINNHNKKTIAKKIDLLK